MNEIGHVHLSPIEVIDRLFECYQTGDLDKVMQLHDSASDISVIGTNKDQFLIGAGDIREEYASDLEQFQKARLKRVNHHVSIVEDTAVCVVSYLVFLEEEQEAAPTPMRLSAVLFRKDGSWRIYHTHLSVALEDAVPEEKTDTAVVL
ncbi:MAG: DUF4440 domain-containing protein [Spartobacteria bacterium]|nr:DUF4440 domain-containing protein [Spartobacteria bacterium]